MIGYIYKTTFLTDNKFYIGRHKAKAFEPNKYLGSGPAFKSALKALKEKAFLENKDWHDFIKCELLEECDTLEQLQRREIFWITSLDARNPEKGYNLNLTSAFGTTGYHHTDEAKAKMSAAKKALPPFSDVWKKNISLGQKGRIVTEETREKIRKANTGKKASDETRQKLRDAHKRNPRNFTEEYRRKLRESRARVLADGTWSISEEGLARLRESGSRPKSEEHCRHISETKIKNGDAAGAKNPRAKKIYCVETDTIYSWAGEAAEVLGLSVHSIRQCRQGKLAHVKGYHFKDV